MILTHGSINVNLFYLHLLQIRKHLRTRRLTSVKQLGSDRIVDFEFSADDLNNTYHIIAEFYAAVSFL